MKICKSKKHELHKVRKDSKLQTSFVSLSGLAVIMLQIWFFDIKSVNLIMFILKPTYKYLNMANVGFQMNIIKLTDFILQLSQLSAQRKILLHDHMYKVVLNRVSCQTPPLIYAFLILFCLFFTASRMKIHLYACKTQKY